MSSNHTTDSFNIASPASRTELESLKVNTNNNIQGDSSSSTTRQSHQDITANGDDTHHLLIDHEQVNGRQSQINDNKQNQNQQQQPLLFYSFGQNPMGTSKKPSSFFATSGKKKSSKLSENNGSQKEEEEDLSFGERYISRPIDDFFEYIRSFSFIGLLWSYSFMTCFVFAIVIYIMGPPVKVRKVYDHDHGHHHHDNNHSSNTSNNSAVFTKYYEEVEYFGPNNNNPSSLQKQFGSYYSIVGSNPSHHHAFAAFYNPSSINFGEGQTDSSSSSSGIPFLQNDSSDNRSFHYEFYEPIDFVNAVYMSVTSFSASGLSSVNYSIWNGAAFSVLGIIMTLGDIVLLTMLPALIRYRALCKEREKLITILEMTGAYNDSDDDGCSCDDSRSENSEYYDETIGMYVNREEFLKTHPGHHFHDSHPSPADQNNTKSNSQLDSGSANHTNPRIGSELAEPIMGKNSSSSPYASAETMKTKKEYLSQSSTKMGESHNNHHHHHHGHSTRSTADARRRATEILNYDDKHDHDTKRSQNMSSRHKRKHGTNDGSGYGSGDLASPLSPTTGKSISGGAHSTFPSVTASEFANGIEEASNSVSPASPISGATPQQGETPQQILSPRATTTGGINLTGPLSSKKKEEQKLKEKEEEERRAAEVAAQLTFGKRIVYEDGLAHVNQQIDICLIIISGVVFYWAANHIVFTLLCMAGGRTFSWSLFHVISSFNNAGLAFSPENMVPINNDVWIMAVLTLLMPLGNTLFPVFFRFQMSLLHRIIRRITKMSNGKFARSIVFGQPLIVWQHSVRLFLRYPRKYYTHMFSKRNTLVLFLLWLAATTIGYLLYIPEFSRPELFPPGMDGWHKFWVALFQTVSVRTTGFAIMNLDDVTTGHLAWWILAMYTSAYPFIVTVRATANENEDDDEATAADLKREATSVVGRDLVWLYLAVMLICYGEHADVDHADRDYSLFLRICFEISSAFGNVGLSLSMPGKVYSYSGSMSTFSIWVMIAVMYCGKHRGLPRTVDEAIAIRVRSYDFSEKELDPDIDSNADTRGSQIAESKSSVTMNSPTGPLKREGSRTSEGLNNFLLSGGAGTETKQPSQLSQYKNNNNNDDDDDYLLMDKEGRFTNNNNTNQNNAKLTKSALANTSFITGGTPKHGPAAAVAVGENDTNIDNTSVAPADGAADAPKSTTFCFYLNEKGEVVRLTADELFERRVRAFYEHYNPARLPHLSRIISAFKHNPNALLKHLVASYGAEPGHARSLSVEAAAARMRAMKGDIHDHQDE